jgi:hypothetical protein
MLSSIKIYLYWDFAAGVSLSLSEAQNPRTPLPPPRVYSVLIHKGKGGRCGELNQREG